jgi:hypothetical protein
MDWLSLAGVGLITWTIILAIMSWGFDCAVIN